MADDEQRGALAALGGSRDRGEAERARAVLLTLAGWTSSKIAQAFGVREDTVRLWRSDFAAGGAAALKASVAPGPPPVKSEAALLVAAPLLEEPVADRRNWTIPRLRAEIEAREGVRISRSQLSKGLAKKKFRRRRPRHTLKGRQSESEVDRVGLRLQLRKRQAEAGDIVLLYGDESEALTHPYLARAWAKSGADLRVPAPGQAKKVAMLGSLDHVTRQIIVHASPTKRSSDFIAHLEQLDRLHGPQPGRQAKAGRAGRGQWPDPHRQTLARRPGRPRTLAHRRMAAEIRARTQRHRADLARPQGLSPRPPHLPRGSGFFWSPLAFVADRPKRP
jgi:transposase